MIKPLLCVFFQTLRHEVKPENLLNFSISVSGGKETK